MFDFASVFPSPCDVQEIAMLATVEEVFLAVAIRSANDAAAVAAESLAGGRADFQCDERWP